MTDGFPEECFLPINPTNCTGQAPDPPHYFFAVTDGEYEWGCHQMAAGQCNENGNSFTTEAECRSRCQGLKHPIPFLYYRLGTVNSNTVNSKFHFIRSFCEMFCYHFPIISCLQCTVNSYFHLIRRKSLPTNDFELTVPDLYSTLPFINHGSVALSAFSNTLLYQ